MPQEKFFLDKTLPTYAAQAKQLTDQGWKELTGTRGVGDTVRIHYRNYLAKMYAASIGKSAGELNQSQLSMISQKAQSEYHKYAMFVRNTGNVNMDAAGGPPPEEFAPEGNMEEDALASLFGSMGLGGGRRRKHRRSKSRRHTRRTKSKRRKTHRR
jgi:hypothetical protein